MRSRAKKNKLNFQFLYDFLKYSVYSKELYNKSDTKKTYVSFKLNFKFIFCLSSLIKFRQWEIFLKIQHKVKIDEVLPQF